MRQRLSFIFSLSSHVLFYSFLLKNNLKKEDNETKGKTKTNHKSSQSCSFHFGILILSQSQKELN